MSGERKGREKKNFGSRNRQGGTTKREWEVAKGKGGRGKEADSDFTV